MANSTLTLTVSLTMIALFTFAIIGFAIGFADDNDAVIRIDDEPRMDSLSSSTKSELDTTRTDTEDTYSSIINTTIESGSDVIKTPAVIVRGWKNTFGTFTNIISVSNKLLFGDNPQLTIFFTTVITIIGLMFTLYIIKAWRGNP